VFSTSEKNQKSELIHIYDRPQLSAVLKLKLKLKNKNFFFLLLKFIKFLKVRGPLSVYLLIKRVI
jgi:hypothetical protein